MTASLAGEVDLIVLLQIGVWACGALWVAAALFPSLLRRGAVPAVNGAQFLGGLLIGSLCLSLWQSPGFLLTAFMLGQFTVMLSFAWVFAARFGPSTYLRHLFAGVCVLALALIVAALLTPDLVIAVNENRFRGERIAPVGAVAALGLVLCLSNVPRMRFAVSWGAIAVFTILLATSRMRTAYVAVLLYLALGYLFGRGLRVRKLVPLLFALYVGLLAVDALAPAADYLVRDTRSIGSLSDRLPLWDHLTRTVMHEEPLIGFGYYAASRVLAPRYNSRLGTAHSAFFEFLVGGGLLGAGLYLALCASLVWFAARLLASAGGRPETMAAVGLLAVSLVLGITSTEGTHAGPVGFSFWSMTGLLPAMWREAAARAAFPAQPRKARGARPSFQPASGGASCGS